MEGFEVSYPIVVRWRDLDPLGHVNNAVIVTYLEFARASYWRERMTLTDPSAVPFVIAHLELDYLRPILFHDQVEVGVRPVKVGGTSFTLEYLIEASGEPAAKARTVQVYLDLDTHRPAPLPEDLKAALLAHMP